MTITIHGYILPVAIWSLLWIIFAVLAWLDDRHDMTAGIAILWFMGVLMWSAGRFIQ